MPKVYVCSRVNCSEEIDLAEEKYIERKAGENIDLYHSDCWKKEMKELEDQSEPPGGEGGGYA